MTVRYRSSRPSFSFQQDSTRRQFVRAPVAAGGVVIAS
jgi:hypothetical protein